MQMRGFRGLGNTRGEDARMPQQIWELQMDACACTLWKGPAFHCEDIMIWLAERYAIVVHDKPDY